MFLHNAILILVGLLLGFSAGYLVASFFEFELDQDIPGAPESDVEGSMTMILSTQDEPKSAQHEPE